MFKKKQANTAPVSAQTIPKVPREQYQITTLEDAMRILRAVQKDCYGQCRDLSFNPTRQEIGQAIQVVDELLDQLGYDAFMTRETERSEGHSARIR